MKMVKSLLLGTAAGLVAIAGAQAADLPVKAKPVQYVKICSLYGAGFYYIPGTDMCLKIGGYVRQQVGYGVNGDLTAGALARGAGQAGDVATRATQDWAARTRGYITADARNQTEYGTVRSYIAVGVSQGWVAGTTFGADNATGGVGFNVNRAFIQFAGFTFGLTQSFWDFYSGPATSFFGGLINPSEDTGDAGKTATAYTAQFGGGFSATISAEGQRNAGVLNVGAINARGIQTIAGSVFSPMVTPTSFQEGEKWPDIVGNIRLDAPWGGAQIMGAIHDASGQYYTSIVNSSTTDSGHPANTVGWAVGAGIKILTPMIGAGDYFQAEVNYANGASGYVNAVTGLYARYQGGVGGNYGFGVMSDGVYGGTLASGTNTSVQLTTAWGVNAAYEHFWSKSWQTSVYGGYIATTYNATANAGLCAAEAGTAAQIAAGTSPLGNVVTGTCNNNWAVWNVGTRTQWNIDSQTALGVDIVYQNVVTANGGATGVIPASGTQPVALRSYSDQNAWMGQFRIHRNFYP
jgi:Porin subfamily